MAIPTGNGTEVIKTAMFKDVDSTDQVLVFGEQHHIYTILSVSVHCVATQAAGTNEFTMNLLGYDSKAGSTAQDHIIFKWTMVAGETFVWNDKFSFFGFEPVDFVGPMDDATKQSAISAQGSAVPQQLQCSTTHADDSCEVTITYINQDWS